MSHAMRLARNKNADVLKEVKAGNPEKVAAQVDPDIEVVQAADRLGIDLEPGTVSQNKSFVELTQSLKAQPGNSLAVSELEAIEALGARGRELVEGVTSSDRADFSDSVRAEFDTTIAEMNKNVHRLHENLIEDRAAQVSVSASEQYMVDVLDEVGGKMRALSPPERDLLELINDGNTTYGAVDRIRRRIGKAYEGQGEYRGTDEGILDQVYGAIAKDQMAHADTLGVGDNLRLANQLVQERKALEKKTLDLFGRDLQKTLVSKISESRTQLGKGDLTRFRKLMASLPEGRRREGAALVVDALMGDNKGRFSLGGFAGVVESFKRNPQIKAELMRHFTPKERQKFNDLETVAVAIQRTKSRENTSGTAKSVLAALESPSVIGKLYGGAKDAARAESVAAPSGFPGAGVLGVVITRGMRGNNAPADAATDLLTSERFRVALRRVEQNEIDKADRIIQGSKEYKSWAKEHPVMAKQAALVGFFSWLSNQEE